jgi:hypothetical protein
VCAHAHMLSLLALAARALSLLALAVRVAGLLASLSLSDSISLFSLSQQTSQMQGAARECASEACSKGSGPETPKSQHQVAGVDTPATASRYSQPNEVVLISSDDDEEEEDIQNVIRRHVKLNPAALMEEHQVTLSHTHTRTHTHTPNHVYSPCWRLPRARAHTHTHTHTHTHLDEGVIRACALMPPSSNSLFLPELLF